MGRWSRCVAIGWTLAKTLICWSCWWKIVKNIPPKSPAPWSKIVRHPRKISKNTRVMVKSYGQNMVKCQRFQIFFGGQNHEKIFGRLSQAVADRGSRRRGAWDGGRFHISQLVPSQQREWKLENRLWKMVKDDVPVGIGYIILYIYYIYMYIENVYIIYISYMFGFYIGFQEYKCDYSSRTQNLCLVSDLMPGSVNSAHSS